jgi:hypothetical protein
MRRVGGGQARYRCTRPDTGTQPGRASPHIRSMPNPCHSSHRCSRTAAAQLVLVSLLLVLGRGGRLAAAAVQAQDSGALQAPTAATAATTHEELEPLYKYAGLCLRCADCKQLAALQRLRRQVGGPALCPSRRASLYPDISVFQERVRLASALGIANQLRRFHLNNTRVRRGTAVVVVRDGKVSSVSPDDLNPAFRVRLDALVSALQAQQDAGHVKLPNTIFIANLRDIPICAEVDMRSKLLRGGPRRLLQQASVHACAAPCSAAGDWRSLAPG